MLEQLKLKLKELKELLHDIQMSDEYIAEREAEYKETKAYKSYEKAITAKANLQIMEYKLSSEIEEIISKGNL